MKMEANPAVSMASYFAGVEDPRIERTKDHQLFDIIVMAICAVICGANDWEAVAEFGRAREGWFKTFLELPHGIPAHDTFWRVFRVLDPDQFQSSFVNWMAAVSEKIGGQVIAIDGKTLRRSHDRGIGQAAIHMISAWASVNHLVLGQRKVDEKSNEITAIPELLRILDVSGCIVTIDALGCQAAIADVIVAQEGDYLLQLKQNQGNLYEDVELLFEDLEASHYRAYTYATSKTVDKNHGRIEIRQAWTISDPEVIAGLRNSQHFAGLKTVMQVRLERRVGQEVSIEHRYYISSSTANAQKLLEAKRSHWQIENSVHWILDIAFREDDSRLRKDHGPQNFAILRHIALNLLKHETTCRLGTQNKRLKAAWDQDYLFKVLSTLFI
jgi:predicted transposase YbfD/YdcC